MIGFRQPYKSFKAEQMHISYSLIFGGYDVSQLSTNNLLKIGTLNLLCIQNIKFLMQHKLTMCTISFNRLLKCNGNSENMIFRT